MQMQRVGSIPALALVLTLGLGLVGCATADGRVNHAGQGALVGSLLGAGLGAVIGHQSGETGEGAAIGAAAGAVGGYVLGNEEDKTQLRTETAAATAAANTVVINVRNSNGSLTPVTLHRQGNLYIGPRGEYYPAVPSEDQLRPIYGF